MTEYWFARRFPAGNERKSMGPVHWKGWASFGAFTLALIAGGMAFLLLAIWGAMWIGLFAFALIRFGLLTALIATVVFRVGAAIPLTTDVGHWSATPSTWTIAAAIAIACFGYYASRAGQPLFGRLLPGD